MAVEQGSHGLRYRLSRNVLGAGLLFNARMRSASAQAAVFLPGKVTDGARGIGLWDSYRA